MTLYSWNLMMIVPVRAAVELVFFAERATQFGVSNQHQRHNSAGGFIVQAALLLDSNRRPNVAELRQGFCSALLLLCASQT